MNRAVCEAEGSKAQDSKALDSKAPVSKASLMSLVAVLAATAACAPERYRPGPIDLSSLMPARAKANGAEGTQTTTLDPAPSERFAKASEPAPQLRGALSMLTVVQSVTERYPPYLSALLERDLASGRLQQAMGAFDTRISAKIGGRLQGFYESSIAQGMLEQPLATGDTIYGGYRVSDGFLPDYYKDRTQDDGEFVFGGSFPLMRNRSIDKRRASVRKAEIDVQLAEPKILAARIEFVRRATGGYYKWLAAGQKLKIARQLFQLAADRQDGLASAVERKFLAAIALTDNERLLAKRRIYIARSERNFQQASLALSLYLRDNEDRPIVATEENLPAADGELPRTKSRMDDDILMAARQRPDLRNLMLRIAKAETERDLAENQVMPEVNLVVEAASSLSNGPYKDREDMELFIGGELKLPLQRRGARGKLQQAIATLSRLMFEQGFARDRIINQIQDTRSALQAVSNQLEDTTRNVTLAGLLVTAEQRAFDLGNSNLLRVQLREVQLADAQVMAIEARMAYRMAHADYRAALGFADAK